MHAAPIKYEVDKATGAMFVDRFLSTSMFYPCNYGYVPHTLVGRRRPGRRPGGEPVADRARRGGALPAARHAEDGGRGGRRHQGAGGARSTSSRRFTVRCRPRAICPRSRWRRSHTSSQHYKDLERGKWVKVIGLGRARGGEEGDPRRRRELQEGEEEAGVLRASPFPPERGVLAQFVDVTLDTRRLAREELLHRVGELRVAQPVRRPRLLQAGTRARACARPARRLRTRATPRSMQNSRAW